MDKHRLARLRARLEEHFEELAGCIGKNKARQVLLALVGDEPEERDDLLRDLGAQVGRERLWAVVAKLRPLLLELSWNVQSDTPCPARLTFRCRYFALDRDDRLRRVPRRFIEAAWDNTPTWCPDLPNDPLDPLFKNRLVGADLRRLTGGDALRLVMVLWDQKYRLRGHYYLRVPLDEQGEIVRGTALLCFQAQLDFRRFQMTPAVRQMRGPKGLPSDFYQQLAVALDVPLREVHDTLRGFGGPLGLAARLGIAIEDAVKMLAEGWPRARRHRSSSGEP